MSHLFLQDHVKNHFICSVYGYQTWQNGDLPDPLVRWLCKITWHTKTIRSPLPQCSWSPNLAGWWLTMGGSHNYVTLWSHGLARSYGELKPLSPLPECLWPLNMVGWRLTLMTFYPKSFSTFWSRGFAAISRDKLKPLCLHFHSVFGHQTWQHGDLPWGAFTHKVTWPYDFVFLQDRIAN